MLSHSCVPNTKSLISNISGSSARLEVRINITLSIVKMTQKSESKQVVQDFTMESALTDRYQVRATVPIKAGTPLYLSRADPLLDMYHR